MTDRPPAKPSLALTLALAGKRAVLPDHAADMIDCLDLAFDTVAARLGELARLAGEPDHPMAERFTVGTARLTLLTGLADGVDQRGAERFVTAPAAPGGPVRLLGAVLPCGPDDFVTNSRVEDRGGFDALWNRCDLIIDVGCRMPPSPPPHAPGSPRNLDHDADRRDRIDAFSAQSEVLLRNADILVAVDDQDDSGRAGGTRESIRRALDVGLSVLLARLGEPGLAVLRTRADFDDPRPLTGPAAEAAVRGLVDEVVGHRPTPRDGETPEEIEKAAYVRSLYTEFFDDRVRGAGWLGAIWSQFERRFRKPAPAPAVVDPTGSPVAEPSAYAEYARRASDLAAAYTGQYRGSFLALYLLAVFAVGAAVASLTMLAVWGRGGEADKAALVPLLILGAFKLGAVFTIFQLVRRGHEMKLAHRGADFRYLAERLRAMSFLPAAGWLRAPANWSLPYTTRLSMQGAMDRLFDAIVRQADPLKTLGAGEGGIVVTLDAALAEATLRDRWLADQGRYHDRNRITLGAMSQFLERANQGLNIVVMVAAAFDLALIGLEGLKLVGLGWGPPAWGSPLLITVAAILPAAVASANGVRFQSECTRLADRSTQMAIELNRLAETPKDRSQPPRMIEVQRLAEDAIRLTLGEVAEWAAIYGKDLADV